MSRVATGNTIQYNTIKTFVSRTVVGQKGLYVAGS